METIKVVYIYVFIQESVTKRVDYVELLNI
jgi:hypothetical protein